MRLIKQLQNYPSLRPAYRAWWERRYGVRPNDVFLVSYPRSGNTWVRFMLLQARPGFQEEDLQRIREIIPDMHGKKPWFECQRTNVVKSHLTHWQPFRNVIYLVRDGRPATFSNWKYQQAEGVYDGSFEEFLTHDHWPSSWNQHVAGWTQARETKLVVRYEDLIRDTPKHLKQMLGLIGWPTSEQRIEEIVQNSTKENMRRLEQSEGIALHRVGQGISSWQEIFDQHLSKQFDAHLGDETRRFLEKPTTF